MDEIVIVDYDPSWPAQFEAEAACLRAALGTFENGGLITRIEHFGSTSVPGLAAKPVIDLLVGAQSIDTARQNAVPILSGMCYAYWPDNPNDSAHLFFVKGLPPAPRRTHHIHLVEPNSPMWERLLFRDYLRTHAETREEYSALKRALAVRFTDDRENYTQAKTEFIQTVMERARA